MHGDSKEERSIAEMDTAVDAIQLLSPIVDDLASDLPAPLDFTQCRKQVCTLPQNVLLFPSLYNCLCAIINLEGGEGESHKSYIHNNDSVSLAG